MVISVVGVILTSLSMITFSVLVEQKGATGENSHDGQMNMDLVKIGAYSTLVILLIGCIIQIIATSLLLHGIRVSGPGWFLPWMTCTGLGIAGGIVVFFVSVANGHKIGAKPDMVGVLIFIISTLVSTFFLVIVTKFYNQLKEQRLKDDEQMILEENNNPQPFKYNRF